MIHRRKPSKKILTDLCVIAALSLGFSASVRADFDPPFPIAKNRKVGPFMVSLWAHPDLDEASEFYVIVDPSSGGNIPNDIKVQIAVQPESGRLPELLYHTWRDSVRNQVQFDNDQVKFDKQEPWRVRLILQSSLGGGEFVSRVEPGPEVFGEWDLLFYAAPFGLVGFLWLRGITRYRNRMAGRYAGPTAEPDSVAEQGE